MTPTAALSTAPGPAFPDPATWHGPSVWQQLMVLLQREWLQQRRGWLVLLAAPTVLLLVTAALGHLQVDFHNDRGEPELTASSQALMLVCGIGVAMMLLGLALSVMVSAFQASGLARRDVQDRSIEFWRSLPVSDGLSLAAPMLAHWLLLPLAAVVADLAGSLLVSAVTVARTDGLGAWLGLPWGLLLLGGAAVALRLALGLVLALVWLSPLLLLVMAASAWLKRWGAPVVAVGLAAGGPLLSKLYGVSLLSDALGLLFSEAAYAFVSLRTLPAARPDLDQLLHDLPALLLADAGRALAALAQPALLPVLASSAGLFALLLWRRRRAA